VNTVPEALLALVDLRVALNTLTRKKMNSRNKHTSLLLQSVNNDKKIFHNIDASAQSFLSKFNYFKSNILNLFIYLFL
jgi:hypothetical protein